MNNAQHQNHNTQAQASHHAQNHIGLAQKALPKEPVQAVHTIAQLATKLIAMADEETQVLVKDDWLGLSALQDNKEALAQNYAMACAEFHNRIEEFRSIDTKLINKLDALQRELGEKTQNNNILIEQMHHKALGSTHKTLLAAQEIAQNVHIRWPEKSDEQGENNA